MLINHRYIIVQRKGCLLLLCIKSDLSAKEMCFLERDLYNNKIKLPFLGLNVLNLFQHELNLFHDYTQLLFILQEHTCLMVSIQQVAMLLGLLLETKVPAWSALLDTSVLTVQFCRTPVARESTPIQDSQYAKPA